MQMFISCLSCIYIERIESKQHFCLYIKGQTKYANEFPFLRESLSSVANVYMVWFLWRKKNG